MRKSILAASAVLSASGASTAYAADAAPAEDGLIVIRSAIIPAAERALMLTSAKAAVAAIRAEDGVLSYDVAQDSADRRVLYLVSSYASQAAYRRHVAEGRDADLVEAFSSPRAKARHELQVVFTAYTGGGAYDLSKLHSEPPRRGATAGILRGPLTKTNQPLFISGAATMAPVARAKGPMAYISGVNALNPLEAMTIEAWPNGEVFQRHVDSPEHHERARQVMEMGYRPTAQLRFTVSTWSGSLGYSVQPAAAR